MNCGHFYLKSIPNLQEWLAIEDDWLLKLPLKMALRVSMNWLELNHELWRLVPWLTTCIPVNKWHVLMPPMEFMASYLVTMWKQKHSCHHLAQIDLLSKLQMTQVDHNLRQTCRYNKENRDNIYDSGTKQRQLSFNTNVFLLVILF